MRPERINHNIKRWDEIDIPKNENRQNTGANSSVLRLWIDAVSQLFLLGERTVIDMTREFLDYPHLIAGTVNSLAFPVSSLSCKYLYK